MFNHSSDTQTFTLSIEPVEGSTYVYGYHLGTIETVARQCAEERFHALNKYGKPTRTVALFRNRKMFDVYDGAGWSSDADPFLDDEAL